MLTLVPRRALAIGERFMTETQFVRRPVEGVGRSAAEEPISATGTAPASLHPGNDSGAACGRRWRHRRRARHGVTSVEYAVLLAAILMVIVAAVRYMGNALDRSFNHSGQQMQNAGM